MKTPEIVNRFVTRPQIQMIGIGEDDLRVQIAKEIARENPLDGRLCTDRHEDRGFNVAVRCVQNAGASARLRANSLKLESEHRFIVGCGAANPGLPILAAAAFQLASVVLTRL